MAKRKQKRLSVSERAKKTAREFKDEFNKAIKTAFIAAFGFLIALVWRDLITEYLSKISTLSPVQGKLITAGIITLVCVLGIFIFTKLFPEKNG